ncbi:ribonuclease H-like domain-containing protein [Tanacetum coccineum]|uniref:Ribonuclease H-like domain-containing protein n=1 Tax=Tanacetum coccineum TaxID=301880 RepID=A0ABQ4WRP4_9ASTR
MEEALPNMVDDRVKELTKTQVSIYVAQGLIMERQQSQADVAKMIANAIQQERENLWAKITLQINNAITNHIPSHVDSSVRNYMSGRSHDCMSYLRGENSASEAEVIEMEPMFLENLHLVKSMRVNQMRLNCPKVVDEMLRQRCTSGDEHQYHIDQMQNFLKNYIMWGSKKDILSLPFPQKPTPVIQSFQRDPKAPVLSLVNQDLLYLKKGNSGAEKIVLSLHKFLTVIFPDDDIEERTSRWVDKCVKKFNPYARYSVEHLKNPHAKIFYIKRQKELGNSKEEVYLNSKIVTPSYQKPMVSSGMEHMFVTKDYLHGEKMVAIVSYSEPDYRNLNKKDIEDGYVFAMYLMAILEKCSTCKRFSQHRSDEEAYHTMKDASDRDFHEMDDAKEDLGSSGYSEGLEKGYDRFQQLLSQLEAHGAEVCKLRMQIISFSNLFPQLVKYGMSMRTNQMLTFVHCDGITNKVKSGNNGAFNTYYSSLQTIFKKEMFLWSLLKLYKRLEEESGIDGNKPVGFDKKKLECFKCHNTGHFARECPSNGTNDEKKRDFFYQDQGAGNKEQNQICLLTMDNGVVNWGEHTVEEEETNHALMAINSNIKVSLCSKTCIDSYNKLKTLCDDQMNQLGEQEAKILACTLAVKKLEAQIVTFHKQQLSLNEQLTFQANEIYAKDEKLKRYRRIGMKAVKEKEQLQKTVDSWKNSSKNLWKLVDSGMTSNSKVGLGYEIQSNNEVLSYEEEMNRTVFKCTEEDFLNKPLYSRFSKTDNFKGVPHPLTGDYTPKPQEEIDDSLYVYGKKGPQKPEISDSADNSTEHSTCQSNDSEGSFGNPSEHSSESESESISVPNEMSTSKSVTANEKVVSESKEVEPSCVTHVKTPRKQMKNQETHEVKRKNWNEMMGRELGEGYSFIKKKCFVCGSLSHLIKDCDYYEKKMAREAELKKQRVFNTGNGVAKPVWNNAHRVNHANQFVPRSVQLNAGRQNVNSVRPNVNTGRVNVNSVRHNVNSVRTNVNTGRSKQPVPTCNSNSFSPVRPQVNKFNQRSHFSKSHSPVRRPIVRNTTRMTYSHAVKGNWGTAVKTSAGYNWRNSRPNSNCDSGPTFIRTDHPLKNMEDRGIFDSGCSGHMTGNKDHLDDFEECKGGSVTFGGSKGYITGKGRIRVVQATTSMGSVESTSWKKVNGTKKLVYRNKREIKRKACFVRNYARIVAQWYTQEKVFDNDEVFAPVARIESYPGKPNLGLWYPRESPFNLEAFSDSDYGGSNLDRKSTKTVYCGSKSNYWDIWFQFHGIPKSYIDNKSTICNVKNPAYHSKTKHIDDRSPLYKQIVRMKKKAHSLARLLLPLTKLIGTLEIHATIDTKGYTITEASIRDSLQLADATGITMLPNDEIFEGMGQMGYPTDGTFTFWKSFFTPQWRYLVYNHLLHSISSKSGGNGIQFVSNIATALIFYSTDRLTGQMTMDAFPSSSSSVDTKNDTDAWN